MLGWSTIHELVTETSSGAFAERREVVLEVFGTWFQPSLRKECLRLGEKFWIHVGESEGHAHGGLPLVSPGRQVGEGCCSRLLEYANHATSDHRMVPASPIYEVIRWPIWVDKLVFRSHSA